MERPESTPPTNRLKSNLDLLQLEKILEILPDFLAIVNLDYQITYINRVERCTSPEALIGLSILEILQTPQEQTTILTELEKIKTSRKPSHSQIERLENGTKRTFYTSITPRLDEAGQILEFIFITRDITAAIETQSSLHHTVANFNNLFYNRTFAFVEVNIEVICQAVEDATQLGIQSMEEYLQKHPEFFLASFRQVQILRANERYYELFERSGSEQFLQVIDLYQNLPITKKISLEFLKALWSGQKIFEHQFEVSQGFSQPKTIAVSINLEQAMSSRRILAGFMDLTPLQKAQTQLQLHQARMRQIMDTSPIGMMEVKMGNLLQLFTEQGPEFLEAILEQEELSMENIPFLLQNIEIEYMNRFGLQMLGVQNLQELQETVGSLFSVGTISSFKHFLHGILRGEKNFRINYPFLNKQGIKKEAEFYFTLPDENSFFQPQLVQFVDVTDYRNIQNELMEHVVELRKANKLLDEFVNTAAHDLRTPLADLVGLSQIYEQDHPRLSQDPIFSMMKSSIQLLIRTVDGLVEVLDIQKDEKHLAKPIHIEDCLKTAVGLYKKEIQQNNAELTWDLQVKEIKYINGYLQSILNNLLSNALKYSCPHRRLMIEIRTAPQADGSVQLTFRDNGVGIAFNDQSKLFQPFSRLNVKETSGTGMGLYLTKTMVEKNGGHIKVESEPLQFTLFTLQLNPYR